MKKLSLALAFGLSVAAFPALAGGGCGGYAELPQTPPVASTDEATPPATVVTEQTQPTTTAQVPAPTTTN
jgi:hypothetical protein